MKLLRLESYAMIAVTQVRATFARSTGKDTSVLATGFWLTTREGRLVFVTNRHVVDPTLKFGAGTNFSLAKLELGYRTFTDGKLSALELREVQNIDETL